ncbi:MAG TPA: hypothetical protein VM074_10250 [Solimonas sp.]|nr:hypothetical protein [Solimonas sp.]
MKPLMHFRAVGAGAVALLMSFGVAAADPFQAVVDDTSNGAGAVTLGFSSVEELFDTLDPAVLANQIGYTKDCTSSCDAIRADLGFRGLDMLFQFGFNSSTLTLRVDGLGVSTAGSDGCTVSDGIVSCAGAGATQSVARKDAIEKLKDFIKNDADFLKNLLTYAAQNTPYDPIAGNPASLMSQHMFADFNEGFTHKVSQVWACGSSAFNFSNDQPIQVAVVGGVSDIFADAQARASQLRAQNEIGIGALFTSTQAKDPSIIGAGSTVTTNSVTIPLSYTVKFDNDPSQKLRIDLPLTYTDTAGATSYAGGFGLAYTYPVSDAWTLTPGIGVGATGSEDLGSAGGVGAGSITSAYTWRLGPTALSMGNAVGYYKSLDIKVGNYTAGADIANTVFTNGLLLTGPDSLIAHNLVAEYYVTDTRITGDEVYSKFYDELGVNLGWIHTDSGVIDSYLKTGVSYLKGDHDIKALKLNLTLRF